MFVVMALLFAALSPGVLIWLPFGASRKVAALVHGIIFAVVWHFLQRPIAHMLYSFEEGEHNKKLDKNPDTKK